MNRPAFLERLSFLTLAILIVYISWGMFFPEKRVELATIVFPPEIEQSAPVAPRIRANVSAFGSNPYLDAYPPRFMIGMKLDLPELPQLAGLSDLTK